MSIARSKEDRDVRTRDASLVRLRIPRESRAEYRRRFPNRSPSETSKAPIDSPSRADSLRGIRRENTL